MTEPGSSEAVQAGKPLESHDPAVEGGDPADPALDEPELHALMRRAMKAKGNVDADAVMAEIGSEIREEEPPPPDEGQATIFEEGDDPRGYSWEP